MNSSDEKIQLRSKGGAFDKYTLKAKELDLQAGLLGKFFGATDSAPINIAGLIAVLIVVPGVALVFTSGGMTVAIEYWKVIVPVLSMILGYVFGRRG